jgi:hypothetical protein
VTANSHLGAAAALAPYDAGVRDLISIIPPGASLTPGSSIGAKALGKIPGRRNGAGLWTGFPGWQQHPTTCGDVAQWFNDGAGLGLCTARYPTIDRDVDNPALAGTIDGAITGVLGAGTPKRVRENAPRVAIPCRLPADAAPFRKRVLAFRDGRGNDAGKVELLGDGNQFVIDGVHPSGVTYRRQVGEEVGGLELLAHAGLGALPELSPALFDERLIPALEPVALRFGLTLRSIASTGLTADRAGVDQMSLRARSFDVLREVVRALPNNDAFDSREARLEIGNAIKAAAGPENDGDALDLYAGWRERKEGGASPADFPYIAQQWATLRPPLSRGESTPRLHTARDSRE